jgi:hypothetical protein
MLPDVLSIGPKLHRNGEMTERDRGMKRLSNLSLGSVGVILGREKGVALGCDLTSVRQGRGRDVGGN